MWNPEANAPLYSAWRDFTENGRLDSGLVSPRVARSWKRSRAAGLDARAPKAPVLLTGEELAALRDRHRALLETALPILKFLETAVHGSGCLLVMTDNDGVVMEAFGDEPLMRMAAENNYVPGCCRTEAEVGTNAIGLALLDREPVQLTGAEHWNVRHHRWTCASAPILSTDGKLLGTVTLSGESVAAHPHTLGMVIAAAETITSRLKQDLIEENRERATRLVASVLNSVTEGLIVVDGTGVVSNVNAVAAKLLGVNQSECVGAQLSRLMPAAAEILTTVKAGRAAGPTEVSLDSKSGARSHFVTSYPLQDDREYAGVILVLSERKAFVQGVRKISGSSAHFTFDSIIGCSPSLAQQLELAKAAARQDSRVLISGETGTGKELVAQAIHNESPRRTGPFVAINCAAIPRELLESEVMGYREGAFSGARKGGQMGKLELADGGTVFLDEIGQMPLDLQSKLLRVLQDSIVTRLGDTNSSRVDIRVIAATNENLFAKAEQGGFRQDLYFRLSVVEVTLPPLRERAGDIVLLAHSLLDRIGIRLGKKGLGISDEALDLLGRYQWPGNIRELENVIELAVILCDGIVIEARHLHSRLHQLGATVLPAAAEPARSKPFKDLETDLLKTTLKEFDGNVALVSKKLGISRATIYRRIKQIGIRRSIAFG